MAEEIERKFLVRGSAWRTSRGERLRQGYLSRVKERTVRVRVAGESGFLTIKGVNRGLTRAEYEYPIPLEDALAMLELCEGPIIDKTRHRIPCGQHVWEVDEFHGANEGLVIAEVELRSADEEPARPDWVGEEVSSDPRYFNANLVSRPYTTW